MTIIQDRLALYALIGPFPLSRRLRSIRLLILSAMLIALLPANQNIKNSLPQATPKHHVAKHHRHKHHKHYAVHGRCHTYACFHRMAVHWRKIHPRPLGQHYTVSSTCYAQGGTTASGVNAYFGEVANNFLPLGTHIMLDTPAFGRREFVILDHIGSGSELDIYNESEAACEAYGRQQRGFRVIP